MSRTERKIGVVALLIIVSLVGLLVVQALLLKNAWDQKNQTFEQSVMAALNSIVQKIETREATKSTLSAVTPSGKEKFAYMSIVATSNHQEAMVDNVGPGPFFKFIDSLPPIRIEDGVIYYSVPSRLHVNLQVLDTASGQQRVLIDTVKNPGQYEFSYNTTATAQDMIILQLRNDSSEITFQASGANNSFAWHSPAVDSKRKLVSRVVDQLVMAEMAPIEQRISDTLLDSLIGATLKESGIDQQYGFGIITEKDSLALSKPTAMASEIEQSDFKTRLFPHDFLSQSYQLALYLPDRTSYLWTQMAPLLAATIIFMTIIALCFTYSIRTIIRQRQFAHRTTDFINNMTHEFKTPISTIALAAEALAAPELAKQEESVQRFGRMIQDENKRMSHQVEKILQMATLEEGDYELNLTHVDLHELITKATDAILIRIQGRGGTLTRNLNATRTIISGDPVHISSIIHNLLDNALKYTPETPITTITTENEGNAIIVRIADNGIGIADADKTMVFEKYYRVSTGNVHNVKGFGIGLSYVKLMTEAHNGSITLESELGKGTQISLTFLLAGGETEGET